MNRTLTGALLLILLLAAGILTALSMSRWNEEIAGQLDTAARQAMEGNPEEAAQTAREAEACWQKKWGIHAAIADHDPLEQIDVGFAQLRIYSEAGETVAFAAICAQLAQQIRAIGEAGSAGWRNIL